MSTWPPTTHQHVQDQLTNAQGWATGDLRELLRLGEHHTGTGGPLWVPGRYYGSNAYGGNTAVAVTANELTLTAFYSPRPRAVDRIGVNVTTAAAALTVGRLGIYNSNPDTGMPTTVLLDAGTVAVDTTGAKEVVVTATLHGLVWLALTAGGGSFSGLGTAMIPSVAGAASVIPTNSTNLGRNSVLPATALPDMTGVTPVYLTFNVPAVSVRAA